ncbi:MAG: hypothetical protein PHF97_04980, partial [Bacteroidales bacterium]|nr:hypothetical protein [Bacteroidales bacterium]
RPFLPKTGWVSAGMAHFSDEKIDTVDWIFYRNQWVGMLRFIQSSVTYYPFIISAFNHIVNILICPSVNYRLPLPTDKSSPLCQQK